MREIIGYKCLICGACLHDVGEHTELTGHKDFSPIYEEKEENELDYELPYSDFNYPEGDDRTRKEDL